jgi:hypothetical protein
MSGDVPKRDVAEADVTEETEPTTQDWKSFKGVVESTVIDTIDRLQIVAGVNQYKGNYYVFIAKVTDKNFQRSFFMMPALTWQKALPVISGYVNKIGEIERKALAQQALEELKRLQALGIDVKTLAQQL